MQCRHRLVNAEAIHREKNRNLLSSKLGKEPDATPKRIVGIKCVGLFLLSPVGGAWPDICELSDARDSWRAELVWLWHSVIWKRDGHGRAAVYLASQCDRSAV